VYDETGAKLFIESREHQAIEICERTNRPVYCYETNGMIQPNRLEKFYLSEATGLDRGFEKYHLFFLWKALRNPETRLSALKYLLRSWTYGPGFTPDL